MKVLVLGRSGQLARALAGAPVPGQWTVQSLGRDTLDLRSASGVGEAIDQLKPDAIINAAAYTGVDQAERDSEAAFALNRDAPGAIARCCAARDLPFVHVSTDYVFDGAKAAPYVEGDARRPLSVYGRSKAEGEDAVRASGARAAIVRTSWVYAAGHANFVTTILRLAREKREIEVVDDQIGSPTWAPDLADACVVMLQRLLDCDAAAEGVVHFANAGFVSRAAQARAIAEEANLAARIVPIATQIDPARAQRPLNSRLDTSRYAALAGRTPRPWREALRLCLRES